jgi:hypothetical protein
MKLLNAFGMLLTFGGTNRSAIDIKSLAERTRAER